MRKLSRGPISSSITRVSGKSDVTVMWVSAEKGSLVNKIDPNAAKNIMTRSNVALRMRRDRPVVADIANDSQFLTFPAHRMVVSGCRHGPLARFDQTRNLDCLPTTAWHSYGSTLHPNKEKA